MLVYSMKAKQTTELENVEKLRTLLEAFEPRISRNSRIEENAKMTRRGRSHFPRIT